jgi:hypothetical protein
MLTIHSICGTLHANLARVSEVRFLVDGQQRETLAGHADLTRTYLTSETVANSGQALPTKVAPKAAAKPAIKSAVPHPATKSRVQKALP